MTNVLSLYKGPNQYVLTICQDTKIFSSFSLHTMTAKLDVEVYTTCDVIEKDLLFGGVCFKTQPTPQIIVKLHLNFNHMQIKTSCLIKTFSF